MLCPELDAETNASPSPLLVHVGGKDAQQTPSARGVSRWSARSGRHVVLCPELDAETNASPSPLLVHVGGKDAQQTPSARGVSRWSARSGRHVVLCPELDAETNASPSPLLFLKQGAASGVHAVHSESMSDYV